MDGYRSLLRYVDPTVLLKLLIIVVYIIILIIDYLRPSSLVKASNADAFVLLTLAWNVTTIRAPKRTYIQA